jgi:hypothetical protein
MLVLNKTMLVLNKTMLLLNKTTLLLNNITLLLRGFAKRDPINIKVHMLILPVDNFNQAKV